jgi:nucleoid-associated protein YgaU
VPAQAVRPAVAPAQAGPPVQRAAPIVRKGADAGVGAPGALTLVCPPVIDPNKAIIYKVASKDGLMSIARQFYGKAGAVFFPLILLASQGVITDPEKIQPGHYIIVPSIEVNRKNRAAAKEIVAFFNKTAAYYDGIGKSGLAKSIRQAAREW